MDTTETHKHVMLQQSKSAAPLGDDAVWTEFQRLARDRKGTTTAEYKRSVKCGQLLL